MKHLLLLFILLLTLGSTCNATTFHVGGKTIVINNENPNEVVWLTTFVYNTAPQRIKKVNRKIALKHMEWAVANKKLSPEQVEAILLEALYAKGPIDTPQYYWGVYEKLSHKYYDNQLQRGQGQGTNVAE